MRIRDWSSDVCSSYLAVDGDGDVRRVGHRDERLVRVREGEGGLGVRVRAGLVEAGHEHAAAVVAHRLAPPAPHAEVAAAGARSEEHTSELQSLMRISYAVFCLKKKKQPTTNTRTD